MDPSPYPLARRVSECPNCQKSPGIPFRASSVPQHFNLLQVGLRCPSCGHEWQMERATDSEAGWHTPAALE